MNQADKDRVIALAIKHGELSSDGFLFKTNNELLSFVAAVEDRQMNKLRLEQITAIAKNKG